MVSKEVESNVTGVDSDTLDLQANRLVVHDLANGMPFRLPSFAR